MSSQGASKRAAGAASRAAGAAARACALRMFDDAVLATCVDGEAGGGDQAGGARRTARSTAVCQHLPELTRTATAVAALAFVTSTGLCR